MCEPACITYTGGATFKCSDVATAKAVAERTYRAAVELFAMLCKEFNLDPLADGVVISHKEGHARGIASNHGDPEHLWSQLGMGYTMDTFRKAVKEQMGGKADTKKGTQASVFAGLSEKDAIPIIGELCKADMKKSGRESDRLNEEKQKIQVKLAEDKGRQEKKAELITFLHEQTNEFDEFDDGLVRRLIEQITVHENGIFTVEFKSGTMVEV